MNTSKTLLATKKLSTAQKDLLSEFVLLEESLIEVFLKRDLKREAFYDCAVFTSQNAVKAVFQENKFLASSFGTVFCVGAKTAQLLKNFGVEVTGNSDSSEALAHRLLEEATGLKITFFCGNLRREELPDLLRVHQIAIEEVEVYVTVLHSVQLQQELDGVLFFSPSAVQSYLAAGNAVTATAFCIGNTTALAAIAAFEKVYVPETPTIEEVVALVKTVF
ncbi:uroporphyrinogen-III synthase [Flavicella sp.]|jgi:uroporphyrinogen-III synthase|nr:uroporphyrinogen-III synthase [Flavicella sp.]MDA9111803.1 uroporphyrinogen-III synthase [Flavicella sp.]